MSASDLIDHLRPFLWLALAAFLVGVFSYVAVGGGSHAAAKPEPAAYAPAVTAPSSDEWNLPKRV